MKFSVTISFFITLFALQTTTFAQSATCSDQTVIDTCVSNQDIYLKTCVDRDYPCLCKWHTAKLSCYDSCLNAGARASEQGLKDTYCSIAQTYNTNSSSVVSSVAPVTPLPSSTMVSALPSASTTNASTGSATTSSSDSIMTFVVDRTAFMFVAAMTLLFVLVN